MKIDGTRQSRESGTVTNERTPGPHARPRGGASTKKMIAGMRMWASLVVLAMGLISIALKQMDYLNGYASFWTTTWDALPPHFTDNDSSNQSVEMAAFIEPKDGTIKSISLLGERNSGTRWIYG